MAEQGNVLIVEDEPSIADNIRFALELDGFNCQHRLLAGDALTELNSNHYDLAIIDVGLPDFNGFELCKKIREFSTIPIIFLTARSDEIDRILGLELGADDYVTKPFSPRELCSRVKAILRRIQTEQAVKPAGTGVDADVNPLQIDHQRACIFYESQRLELTRTEYQLLTKLIENPTQVFTREQLMQAAWENPEHSLDRAVDTHIKTLRAKLKQANPASELIKTHRGLGYSLKV